MEQRGYSMNRKHVSLAAAAAVLVGMVALPVRAQEAPLDEGLLAQQPPEDEGRVAQAQPDTPPPMGDEHEGMAPWHMRMMQMRMMRQAPRERCIDRVAHEAGHLAYIEVRLNLTPEQRPLWDKLDAAAQAGIEKQRQVCLTIGNEDHPPTVLDREARAEQLLTARLALLQSTRPALEALYGALTPEQRALLDRPWPHGHS
jgi:hypothetical protein